MNESILQSIKSLLGLTSDDDSFDAILVMHINSAIMILRQLGIGPKSGYSITGVQERWTDYIPNITDLQSVKMYIYLQVKKIFDPPASSSVAQAIDAMIKEYEFRLNVEAENPTLEE